MLQAGSHIPTSVAVLVLLSEVGGCTGQERVPSLEAGPAAAFLLGRDPLSLLALLPVQDVQDGPLF